VERERLDAFFSRRFAIILAVRSPISAAF
jgi:hypothetical protein